MSSERINSIDMRINKLNQEATNLKTSQYTGWDSIRAYKIETTNEYDYSYTGAIEEILHLYVKFIADHQEAPFAKVVMQILVNDAAWYRVGYQTYGLEGATDYGIATNGWVPDVYGSYSPTQTPNRRNELSWYNAISFVEAVNIKVKFTIYSVDSGRMVVGIENDGTEGYSPEIIIS